MKLTRRETMKVGAGAVVAVAVPALPVMAGGNPDAVLLARVATFWRAYEQSTTAHEEASARREVIEAMPDYPHFGDGFDMEKWQVFMDRHGWNELWDRAQEAGKQEGQAANAVFATPARSLRGAVEKVKIVRIVTGIGAETGDGDADLGAYQDFDAPWIDNAIADLERLAG